MLVLCETERIAISPFSEKDIDNYRLIISETHHSKAFDNPIFNQQLLNLTQDVGISFQKIQFFSVYNKPTMEYCGNPELQPPDESSYPGLGVSILTKYQNKGIGTEAVFTFANYLFEAFSTRRLRIRISRENARSIHVFEKLGARFVGEDIHPLVVKAYELARINPPDDENLRALNYYLDLPLKCERL